MKLENQVVSLKLSKKLKKLGLEQDSLWYWINILDGYWKSNKRIWSIYDSVDIENNPRSDMREQISAFTVAELGEMLPKSIVIKRIEYWFNVARMSHGWVVGYVSKKKGTIYQSAEITEANARAKMLIYLLENKLL